MKVKALQRFPYDGKQVEIGEEFDMPVEIHARIMEHAGSVQIVTDAPPPKPVVQTRVMKAEEPPPSPAKPMTTDTAPEVVPMTPKRSYRRRDLKAEE